MPLSDREERILAEIERQLADDDPRFVARARRTRGSRPRRPRLPWAIAGFVVGLLCLFGLVVHIALGFVGFTLMFVSVLVAVPELQRRRDGRLVDHQS